MGICEITKTSIGFTIGLAVLAVHQFSTVHQFSNVSRNLSQRETSGIVNRIRSYSSPGSIAAVINTAKMGTGGLQKTFCDSWMCPGAPPVVLMAVHQCDDDRRIARTHSFSAGSKDIQNHRKQYPVGECLITTALRSPAYWFGSMYLQDAKNYWKPKEDMLQDYRKFLATDNFNALHQVLPGLLKEFNAGTLVQQAKIMDENGGYSLIPAPESSILAGCDLLFLRMEQSDQWPDIFKMLDPDIINKRGNSRLQDHPDNNDQINAIATYKLTSEEKFNIYNNKNSFIQDWFDAYGYMDDAVDYN